MSAEPFLERYRQLGVKLNPSLRTAPALRVNTLLTTAESLIHRLHDHGVRLSKIPYAQDGFWIEKTPFSLGASLEYLRGLYYLQDAAAQLPVQVLAPSGMVLDMCAAPGGKTTQIAQALGGKGVVVAFEKETHRLQSLKTNLERCQVPNVVVYHSDGANAANMGIKFDSVLLDAPCSGNFAGDPRWFDKRTLADVKRNVPMQQRLLKAACDSLADGGNLVYSTCSLEPEEDEMMIDWALKNLPLKCMDTGVSVGVPGLVSVFGRTLDPQISRCRRLWPDGKHEGFFVAKLVKVKK